MANGIGPVYIRCCQIFPTREVGFGALESDDLKTRLRELGTKQLKELELLLSDMSSYLMEDKDRLDSSCSGAKA